MSYLQQSNQNIFSRMMLIFAALLIGQILFLAIAFILVTGTNAHTEPNDYTLLYIGIVLTASTITAGILVANKRLNAIRHIEDQKQKLEAFSVLAIIRMALLEGANLFAIIGFILTHDTLFAILAGFGVGLFITFIPLRERVKRMVDLQGDL